LALFVDDHDLSVRQGELAQAECGFDERGLRFADVSDDGDVDVLDFRSVQLERVDDLVWLILFSPVIRPS